MLTESARGIVTFTCTIVYPVAPPHLLPEDIPYDLIQFGPAFPSMGGLILEFPSLELAMRVSAALEQSMSSPKVFMLPTIHVGHTHTHTHTHMCAHTHTHTHSHTYILTHSHNLYALYVRGYVHTYIRFLITWWTM